MINVLRDKYESRVIKKDGCWDWNGNLLKGYARLTYRNKFYAAHRVSWMINKGEIPRELCVLHTCDTRHCTRIEHLFLGSYKDNYHDMRSKGRLGHGAIGNCFTSKPLRPKTILNINEVARIKKMIASKEYSMKYIADQFSVCTSTIYNIKNNKIWKDVQ